MRRARRPSRESSESLSKLTRSDTNTTSAEELRRAGIALPRAVPLAAFSVCTGAPLLEEASELPSRVETMDGGECPVCDPEGVLNESAIASGKSGEVKPFPIRQAQRVGKSLRLITCVKDLVTL